MLANIPAKYRASKPPTGLHLDVLKDKKLIQKLMVDDKRCYLFGRNSQLNDFCIDHQGLRFENQQFLIHYQLIYHIMDNLTCEYVEGPPLKKSIMP